MAEGLGYYGLMATISMGLAPMIGIWLVTGFGYSRCSFRDLPGRNDSPHCPTREKH